jgi:hypothetical protein
MYDVDMLCPLIPQPRLASEPAEFWLPIKGLAGVYEVSDKGRVRNKHKKILKPYLHGSAPHRDSHLRGYRCLSVRSTEHPNSKFKRGDTPISHLVLETFHGSRPKGLVACHGPNGNLDDSAYSLAWKTQSENLGADMIRDGTSKRGENNPNTILNEIDVHWMRLWHYLG